MILFISVFVISALVFVVPIKNWIKKIGGMLEAWCSMAIGGVGGDFVSNDSGFDPIALELNAGASMAGLVVTESLKSVP